MKYELYAVVGNKEHPDWVVVLYSKKLDLVFYPETVYKAGIQLEFTDPGLRKAFPAEVYYLGVNFDNTKYRFWSNWAHEITENEFREYLQWPSLEEDQATQEATKLQYNYDRFESREDNDDLQLTSGRGTKTAGSTSLGDPGPEPSRLGPSPERDCPED